MRKDDEVNSHFFIKTTALVFIFYTAVNSLYINLIFPFICIGLLGSIKKVRVLALLEIAAMWVEQLFNTIHYSSGGYQGDLMLSLYTFPAACFVRVPTRQSRALPLDPHHARAARAVREMVPNRSGFTFLRK